jgi:hypothetical protein
MKINRRYLAAVGAVAFGMSSLLPSDPSLAESAEEAAVDKAVEALVGDAAVVRHLYESESETDGKPANVKIGALQVWLNQGGDWKLLARQGFKLA